MSIHICVYVYIYPKIQVPKYTCRICMNINTCQICIHIHMHVYIYTYTSVHTCMCAHVFTYIHIQMYTNLEIHTYIHTYMYIYVCTSTNSEKHVCACAHAGTRFCASSSGSLYVLGVHATGETSPHRPHQFLPLAVATRSSRPCRNVAGPATHEFSRKDLWFVIL